MAKVFYDVKDIEELEEGTTIWTEIRTPIHYADQSYVIPDKFRESKLIPMVMYHGILGNYYKYLYPSELNAADAIRMFTRVWDVKPTEEEMAAEPWPTYDQCQRYWQ